MYIPIRKVRNYFVFIFETVVSIVVGISNSLASFVTFTFATEKSAMSHIYFCHDGILLLFFNKLCTALPRLLITLTIIIKISNTVKLTYRFTSVAADGTILGAISHYTCDGSMIGHLTAFVISHKRFMWWLHSPHSQAGHFKLQRKLATVIINIQNICGD